MNNNNTTISNPNYTSEIQILHFSDMHFGSKNISRPLDLTNTQDGYKELGELITEDLRTTFAKEYQFQSELDNQTPPLIIALSGDFTQEAKKEEFSEANDFLNKLLSNDLLDRKISKEDIYMIPGNHDVVFDKKTEDERFQPYCSFYNQFYENIRPPQLSHKPIGLTQIHTIEKEGNKVLLTEINCCMYVEKDTVDQSRGQVSMAAIGKLEAELKELSQKTDLKEYIKVAIIHHHVVLMPSLIEPKRGVDAVQNARALLELLSAFDFHLILHGHKHYPQIFTYDPLPLWVQNKNKIPQLIISGGSCGSRELPSGRDACNTYGLITIKWHPNACQARIRIVTRGLMRNGQTNELPPHQWTWETINISDKILTPYKTLPSRGHVTLDNLKNDSLRISQYEKLRGRFPVVEILPSLIPEQAYEARVWIVAHKEDEFNLDPEEALIKVEWSAGENFLVITANVDDNSNFCSSFHYWGPMLIEAKLIFKDGYEASTFLYARMPKTED